VNAGVRQIFKCAGVGLNGFTFLVMLSFGGTSRHPKELAFNVRGPES
jgi:hypothetical protein